MKNAFKRVLMILMVMLLAVGAVAPAAMATEVAVESNATNTMSLYVGMSDTLFVSTDGVIQSPSLFWWRSSNSKVVSVDKRGNIIARKVGTAIIYATRKSNGDMLTMKVKAKRNKVDNIYRRPAATVAPYKKASITLKSVEIAAPNKVVVEYYLCCNFPAYWMFDKVESLEDAIFLYNRSTGDFEKLIVGDDYQVFARSISGAKQRYGRSVQVIKATFTGTHVYCRDVKLADYIVDNSANAKFRYTYYY